MNDHVARLSVKGLSSALKQAAQWADWEAAATNDFHEYAQRFGCEPGVNVFEFVLRDALRLRGETIEQFQRKVEVGE